MYMELKIKEAVKMNKKSVLDIHLKCFFIVKSYSL